MNLDQAQITQHPRTLLGAAWMTVANADDMASAFKAAVESLHGRHAEKTDSVLGSLGGPELAPVFARGGSTKAP